MNRLLCHLLGHYAIGNLTQMGIVTTVVVMHPFTCVRCGQVVTPDDFFVQLAETLPLPEDININWQEIETYP